MAQRKRKKLYRKEEYSGTNKRELKTAMKAFAPADKAVFEKASKASSLFFDLFQGKETNHNSTDKLLKLLAYWCEGNAYQVERLFCLSKQFTGFDNMNYEALHKSVNKAIKENEEAGVIYPSQKEALKKAEVTDSLLEGINRLTPADKQVLRHAQQHDKVFSELLTGKINSDESKKTFSTALAFFCNGNVAQIDRIFRASGQMPENYFHKSGEMTHGMNIILDGINNFKLIQREHKNPEAELSLADKAVLEKASKLKGFDELYNTKSSDEKRRVQLCSKLAYFCNGDTTQMDRLFRASALMSDEWDKPSATQTVGEGVIRKSMAIFGMAKYAPSSTSSATIGIQKKQELKSVNSI